MRIRLKTVLAPTVLLPLLLISFVWAAGAFVLGQEKQNQKNLYLDKQTASQSIAWGAVINSYKAGMEAYFDAYISTPKVAEIMQVANSGDENKKNVARGKLYADLSDVYKKLQKRGVRQLQFHTKESVSFLRFHQPHNYGDSLLDLRPSVAIANREKRIVYGFETGRVVSGFRNVFPIVYGGEHLGSVELSQPFEALKNEFAKLYENSETVLVIKTKALSHKLFEENKRFFHPSYFSDEWMIEDDGGFFDGKRGVDAQKIKEMSKRLYKNPQFLSKMQNRAPFSVDFDYKNEPHTVTVTPIIDVSGAYSAALVSFKKSEELSALNGNYATQIFIFTIFCITGAGMLVWFAATAKTVKSEKNRLQTITSTMGEGLYVTDTNGAVTYINDTALRMLKITREIGMGEMAHYLFHGLKDDSNFDISKCWLLNSIKSGEHYSGEDIFTRSNGESFSVAVTSSPIVEDNEIVGCVVVFRDVSERVRLESELKELNRELEGRVYDEVAKRVDSEFLFYTLFDKSPEGILLCDENAVIIECNDSAAKMLGYERSELVGLSPVDISPEIQPDTGFFSKNATKYFLNATKEGNMQHFEWAHITKSGSIKNIDVVLSTISMDSGVKILVLWRDNSEVKKLQKEREAMDAVLIQQSKLAEMGSMIGAIAHQWKQPLNAIWIMVQDLKMSYEYGELTSDEMEKFKNEMGEQVQFMSQTIEDFRNFYKPSTKIEDFYASKAVLSVLSLLKKQLEKEGISVTSSTTEGCIVSGFESEFKQVVLNIINNARDALIDNKIKGPKIKIEVLKDDEFVSITVEDNAGGISEKLLSDEKIFEPFNTTKGDKGTGVGLSLAKTIIEKKMNGKLTASNSLDGALFCIKLPLAGR